jgi:hypothetical protein
MRVRNFTDDTGRAWTAHVVGREGLDYQGRYHLVLKSEDGADAVALEDIRWNNERTARRTLETMSDVELRRRLRSAVGRGTKV